MIPTDFIFLFIIRVVFFMIRVDPSPILFYFYFLIRSELVQVDPTWTGGPSWSGPTFVPASYNSISKKSSQQVDVLKRLRNLTPRQTKLQLYKAAVLPYLTYCHLIWHLNSLQLSINCTIMTSLYHDLTQSPLESTRSGIWAKGMELCS